MNKDPNDAPKAGSTHWYKCDACEQLHLFFADEAGEVIATALLSREMLVHMLEALDGDAPETHVQ